MTAIADFTTICTILKGSAPTNQQLINVADLFAEYLTVSNPTNEQKAQAAIAGMGTKIRKQLHDNEKGRVIATEIAKAHYPADQPAILAAVEDAAEAAGVAAEGSL